MFEAIYYHKSRRKSVEQIMAMTGLPRIRVLQEANDLARQQIVGKVRRRGESLAYEQEEFYQANKKEILRLLNAPKRLASLPTKRNPRTEVKVSVRSETRQAAARLISVDDVGSFSRLLGRSAGSMTLKLPELAFKLGLQKIVGEPGVFKDWGGEKHDLFTTRLVITGKRRAAAFALKGPATRGKLVLSDMGKNGDQIPRLFQTAAEVFFVQYHSQIDPMILEEMEIHAGRRARQTGRDIYYGIIDGADSQRLIDAYPSAFRASKTRSA